MPCSRGIWPAIRGLAPGPILFNQPVSIVQIPVATGENQLGEFHSGAIDTPAGMTGKPLTGDVNSTPA